MIKRDMKKIFLSSLLFLVVLSSCAQVRMRDVFAQLPDSVLPLLTKNNRLDCIDFIENNMEARVKNRFNDHVVLEALTDEEIEYYVQKYRPMDKAGSYGVQEWIGYIGITGINGSYFNVMGLPVQRLYGELKGFGLK